MEVFAGGALQPEGGSLKGVVLVVDSRHPPMASDVQMFQWLLHYRKPVLVVATKTDKLSRREYNAALQRLEQALCRRPGITPVLL